MAEKLKAMPLSKHVAELKYRFFISIILYAIVTSVVFAYSAYIYDIIIAPLAQHLTSGRKLIFTGITEGFITHIRLSFFVGFIITFPVILWQIYKFIIPALYKNEKYIMTHFFMFSLFLFFSAIAIVYFFVMPVAWGFFLTFEMPSSTLPVILEARISEYLNTVISMVISFVIAFQLPIVLIILVQLNIISIELLTKSRKYFIVGIFIIAAILTPPDVLSQIMLAIPLLMLYEVTILICKFYKRKGKNNA